MSRSEPPALLSADDLDAIVERLAGGAVVAVPTDTVFGLAALLTPQSVARVFAAKGRPADLALPVLIGGWGQVGRVASSVPNAAATLAARFWPGPLTLVVPARRRIGALVGGSGRSVGIRWPDHPLIEELCLSLGPLAVTSANRHGEPPCTSAAQVRARFVANEVAAVVEGRAAGVPSTVVDCTGRRPGCLREGATGWAEIEAALSD